MALPPAIRSREPCRIVAVASVMIRGWTRSSTTPMPLIVPTQVVIASTSPTPSSPTVSQPAVTSGSMMAAKVMVLATDRSIPAAMITSVWPAAAMPVTAASSSR